MVKTNKIIIAIMMIIALAGTVTAWSDYDMCDDTYAQAIEVGRFNSPTYHMLAATNFSINETKTITTISHYLEAQTGTPSNLEMQIRTDGSGKPSTTIIANGTNTTTPSSWSNYTVNATELTADTVYWIVWTTSKRETEPTNNYWYLGGTNAANCPNQQNRREYDTTYNPNNWAQPNSSQAYLVRLYFDDSTPPPQQNTTLTITAEDIYNRTNITNFKVNYEWANGTTGEWNTVTGTIAEYNELKNDSTWILLTYYNASNYYATANYNVSITANTSNSHTGLMKPIKSDFYIQINATDITNGTKILNFTTVITGWDFGDSDANGQWDTGIEQNNTELYNLTLTSNGYTTRRYYNINFSDTGNFTAQLVNNETHVTNIGAINSDGTYLTSPQWTINGTDYGTSNPLQTTLSNWINYTTGNITRLNITVIDTLEIYTDTSLMVDITFTNATFNITLGSQQVTINLLDGEVNASNLTSVCLGYSNILSFPLGREFNTSTITFNTTDILHASDTSAKVTCSINKINYYDVNFTNYYEFFNDGSEINENITLVKDNGYFTWLRVQHGGEVINNAIIRAYMVNYSKTTWLPANFIGQRITDERGKTSFYTEDGYGLALRISAEGFEDKVVQLAATVGDDTYDEDIPFQISLDPQIESDWKEMQLYAPSGFRERNADIPISLHKTGHTIINYNTQYNIDNGGLSPDAFVSGNAQQITGSYTGELEAGKHFSTDGSENITLYIYLDGSSEIAATFTIEYIGDYVNSIFAPDILSGYNQKIVNPLLMVLLIMLCFIASLVFQGDMGKHVWFIGGIILAGFSTTFAWVAYANTLYYGLKLLRKVIGE